MPQGPTQGALDPVPIRHDDDQDLLYKISLGILGIQTTTGIGALGTQVDLPAAFPAGLAPESVIALLKAILNKQVTIDASNSTLVLNLDEVEAGIGLTGGVTSAKETDPDVVSSIIGYLRGLLEAANSIVTLLGGMTSIATYTSTSVTPGGAAYTALTAQVSSSFRFVNNTGEILEFRTVAGGDPTEEVAAGASITYPTVANMSEWEWRKKAATAGALTIKGVAQN